MPKLSIIIPIYNGEEYIERCLNSVLKQKFRDFEIILVNDGSTDKSGEICNKYVEFDSRIKVIHQENRGQSKARKTGLNNAVGEYIGFIDIDDWISEDMYSHLVEIIEKNDCDVALLRAATTKKYMVHEVTTENLRILDREKNLHVYLENGLKNSMNEYSLCNKLYKKELFRNIEFDYANYGEDYVINFKILSKIKRMIRSDKIGYYYYQGYGSAIRGRLKKNDLKLLNNCKIVIEEATKIGNKRLIELAEIKLSQSYYSLLIKGRLYGVENDMKKSDIKKLQDSFSESYLKLLSSEVPFIKKIIMTMLLITNILKIPFKIYNLKEEE